MNKTFYYDYFSLEDVDPEVWFEEFFWPVPRATTTQITVDLKNKLCRMIDAENGSFEGDCLLIAHLLPDISIKVINHYLALTRLKKEDYTVTYSKYLNLIPKLLEQNTIPDFPHENMWEKFSMTFCERKVRQFKYFLNSLRYNFFRGNFTFWNHFFSSKKVVAFSNENVIYRHYTLSLNKWVQLTAIELWLDSSKVSADEKSKSQLTQFAEKYQSFIQSYAVDKFDLELPGNFLKAILKYNTNYLHYLADLYISLIHKVEKKCPEHLLTPTAGAAFIRALSLAVRKAGGKVTGFPHGYYISHHKGSRKTLHEFATPDEFMAYTPGSVPLMKKHIALNPPPGNNHISFPYEQNRTLLDQWLKYRDTALPKKHQTVMVLELSLIPEWAGYYAAEAMVNYHFYYNICKMLGEAGYKVLFKRRPKDYEWDGVNIFKDLPNVKVIFGSFEDKNVLDRADAYIIQYGMSSTLFQAMCTNKTVIYADAGWEEWFPETYELMEKRCEILHCSYDERNRACFDKQELINILEQKPAPPNTEFIEKYLFPTY